MWLGVDIGGTFTDCVVVDEEGRVTIGKSLSTPADFSQGALNSVADAANNLGLKDADELLRATRLFFHACTIGDNTLITRAGAKTGLIMTKGFGDSLHIMRGKVAEGPDGKRNSRTVPLWISPSRLCRASWSKKCRSASITKAAS